jgi:hypothetical protein
MVRKVGHMVCKKASLSVSLEMLMEIFGLEVSVGGCSNADFLEEK